MITMLTVQSPSFENNEAIPIKHTGFGEDCSPALTIGGVCPQAVSLAIVMVDLDIPVCPEFAHWLIWNIPVRSFIPEGIPQGAKVTEPFSAVQGIGYGKNGYRGPKQPFFIKKAHRYRFFVYALDTSLSISSNSSKKQLLAAMQGHILQMGSITGVYQPTRGRK